MPLIIVLKEPPINIIAAGEIKDDSEKEWDKLFNEGVLMVKNQSGHNIIIPLWKESNVTFIQEVTEEQLEEQRKLSEEMQKGNTIVKPDFAFPQGRTGRGRGGGVTL